MFPFECIFFFLPLQNWMTLHMETFKGLCPLKIVLCLREQLLNELCLLVCTSRAFQENLCKVNLVIV